jgi:heat shock protein HslJ
MLVALLLAAPLAACGNEKTTTEPTAVVPGHAVDLVGTEWVLASLNGESLIEGTEINLRFDEAFLTGSMTCNGYGGGPDSGGYVATADGTLTIGEYFAVTVQLCSEPAGIMEQEAAYIEALLSADSYRVVEDRLEITSATGDAVLVFERLEGDGVTDPVSARDAVLAHLSGLHGEQAPGPETSWIETRRTTLPGKTTVEFESVPEDGKSEWLIRISF